VLGNLVYQKSYKVINCWTHNMTDYDNSMIIDTHAMPIKAQNKCTLAPPPQTYDLNDSVL
jgi:hypothetical protein